jgi:hypothetical protein
VDCGGGTGDGRRPTGDDGKTRTETGSGEVTALPPLGPVLGRGKTGSTAGWTRPRSTCTSAKKQRMNTEWGNPKVNMNGNGSGSHVPSSISFLLRLNYST